MDIPGSILRTPSETNPARKSVLLVEDDDAVARLFGKVLRSANYDVVRTADAIVAKTLFDEAAFDAVVTDIELRSMSGIDLLKLVRARDENIPIVVVSGKPVGISSTMARRNRADCYLVKPVRPVELARAVAEAIEAHTAPPVHSNEAPSSCQSSEERVVSDSSERWFAHALQGLHMVYQPIVCPGAGRIVGYQALMRTEGRCSSAGELTDVGTRLGAGSKLSVRVRALLAEDLEALGDALVFIHHDLGDRVVDGPSSCRSYITRNANRTVIEIPAGLPEGRSGRARIQRLKDEGFRVAMRHRFVGTKFVSRAAALAPDFIKADIRDLAASHRIPAQDELVGSLVQDCAGAGIALVLEGVSTRLAAQELISIGVSFFQGDVFSLPRRSAHWESPKRQNEICRRLGYGRSS